MSLEGKTALVTGAGSGIGRATALLLAQRGACVIVNDLDLGRARAVAEEVKKLGKKALALQADVSDFQAVAEMVARGEKELFPVDILVNNAGMATVIPFHRMEPPQWQRMLDVHLGGTLNCTRAVINGMIERRWGRVVSISSIAALSGGGRGLTHYSAAKAGIVGFTKGLAREVAEYNITANAVAPGPIETPMVETFGPKFVDRMVQATPMKRLGRPEEIAYAVVFLASEEASFITGQVISPNGGHYI